MGLQLRTVYGKVSFDQNRQNKLPFLTVQYDSKLKFASVLVMARSIEISGSLESSRVAEALRTIQADRTTNYANERRRIC